MADELRIPGYPNYTVSRRGEVVTIKTNRQRKLHKNLSGYLCIALARAPGEKAKALMVHRLVAAAYISNPTNLPEINHKNLVRTDNRVENLEWISRSDKARARNPDARRRGKNQCGSRRNSQDKQTHRRASSGRNREEAWNRQDCRPGKICLSKRIYP